MERSDCNVGRVDRAIALARGRRENRAEARRQCRAEAMIAREPQVLIPIASVGNLVVIRGAQVELVIEQQPPGRPGALLGSQRSRPSESLNCGWPRLSSTGSSRSSVLRRIAPNHSSGRPVGPAEGRGSCGDRACGDAIFVARWQRRRRHADDTTRARAVLDRKATAEDFDRVDRGRVDALTRF